MDYIRFAIANPVKITVAVILIILFGLISLTTIPIQLVPNVDEPVITVKTTWTGRSPEEIEQEIIEEQEDKLKSVSSLRKMSATASQGEGAIELEFFIGTNMSRGLQEVSDKLREVPEYPDDVDEPVITVADGASENAIAWMVLTSGDSDFDIETLRDAVEDRIKPHLERVAGLSEINVYGGRDREVHVQIDPNRMAQRGITFNQLREALRLENVNVSAGDLAEGRLDVRIRTIGQYDRLEDIRETIVTYGDGGPVRVADLGMVTMTLSKRRSFVRSKGQPAIALNAIRETGANVMEVMTGLRKRIEDVNRDVLPGLGPQLTLVQVYDETIYIHDAIRLVLNNLWIGGSLAGLVLLLFLRILRPTLVVALAIPVSIVGTFVAMTAAGRNLNVVSLAGLAFAVGMVVDNAIVVLENIDRHLGMGKLPGEAAYDATNEVWGAILASTLTTLAVFVPVLTIEEETGQLFRDIALAICAAVTLSLIVAVTVIPSASARWLRRRGHTSDRASRSLFGLTTMAGRASDAFVSMLYASAAPNARAMLWRLLIVAVFTGASILGAVLLMPPASYLPNGNRNLTFGVMLTPPGYNIEHNETIAHRVEATLRPYWEAKDDSDVQGLPPMIHPFTQQPITNIASIENYFFVSFGGTVFMGCSSRDKNNVRPHSDLLTSAMNLVPGAIGFAFQPSIFGRGVSGGNAIDVEIVGNNMTALRRSADSVYRALGMKYGFSTMRPDPTNFNIAGPELQVKIDRVRAADLGVDVAALGLGVQALIDGVIIGDYRLEGESIDILMVRDPAFVLNPDRIDQVSISVREPDGRVVSIPLGAIARTHRTDAPQQIKRIEERRAVTLTLRPPEDVALEQVSNDILSMIKPMRANGQIDRDVEIQLAGTADKLTQVRAAFLGKWTGLNLESLKSLGLSRFFLVLAVTFLLMAALFESFIYPFVIMFTVPLATVGGFLGLRLVHEVHPTQQLDVLTMLGFVLLIGIVVNNAILIVHQALNFMHGVGESKDTHREPMDARTAIRESVRSRIRPVFMTTATSVFGMLPLVLMPGAGSELYRGLGSVVVGGLLVSTLFTLIVVPLLFSLVSDVRAAVQRPKAPQVLPNT